MGERREDSSVLFSLEGLMAIEKDRVEKEEVDRARRQASERARKLQAELSALRERELRAEADAARRREVERRQREEEARLAAIRHAQVERARMDAQAQAERELAEKQFEHQRRLQSIEEGSHLRRWRYLSVAGALIVGALLVGATSLYFGRILPDTERRSAAAAAAISDTQKAAEDAKRELERLKDRRRAIEGDLSEVRREKSELEADEHRPVSERKAAPRARPRPKVVAPAPVPRAPQPVCDPNDPDPMNGCLP